MIPQEKMQRRAGNAWGVALLCAILGVLAAPLARAESLKVKSLNGEVTFQLMVGSLGDLSYWIKHKQRSVIAGSSLGFKFQSERPNRPGYAVQDFRRRDGRETWEQPWGETRFVDDAYRELEVDFEAISESPYRMTMVVRVFDDGVGFRFKWPEQENLNDFAITRELTEFNFTKDPIAWWIPAYAGNRYEHLYRKSRLSALSVNPDIKAVHTPLTLETQNGLYVAIHEAALTDYASMTLIPGALEDAARDKLGFSCDLVPWADGVKVYGSTPFETPWRTIHVGETPGDLVESTMTLSLNEPSRIDDVSWIQPGKYTGIWWSLHIGKESWKTGPIHGATTANAKRYIDFAAENNFSGVLVEGWNVGWDQGWLNEGVFDYTTPTPDYDLEEVCRYAREQGVTMIGHLETGGDVHGFDQRMEAAFGQCERLGIRAVKMGYVSHGQGIRRYDDKSNLVAREWQHGQYMVRHFRKMVESAAKHNIMVNVHEPIKDTGIRRTWPNMMTREGARGQEYNAWSEGNGADHTTILPFTRMLSGPMDFTPGIFNVMIEPYRENNRVPTTVAKQLALYVVIYSPFQMATDLIEHYRDRPAFGFIQSVPVDWEETRVLHGVIGDYVTIARRERGGDRWFLGSITDENARAVTVRLDFLEADVEYDAYIYRDARGASYEHHPDAMQITRESVRRGSVILLELASSGGQAIEFRPRR